MSILSMSAEAYFASTSISRSDLEGIMPPKTPAHYLASKMKAQEESTPAQRIGTIVHRCILEPDSVKGAFHVKPECMNFSTKYGKKWKEDHADREVITAEEADMVRGMVRSVWNNPIAARLITGARHEACVFADDEYGMHRKARIDIFPNTGSALADIKTATVGSIDSFCKSILEYGYHRQAAYSLDLVKLIGRDFSDFVFIVVEKEAPYLVATYPIDPESIEVGRIEYKSALANLKLCQDSGQWPGYPVTLDNYCGLPHWYLKRLEQV